LIFAKTVKGIVGLRAVGLDRFSHKSTAQWYDGGSWEKRDWKISNTSRRCHISS